MLVPKFSFIIGGLLIIHATCITSTSRSRKKSSSHRSSLPTSDFLETKQTIQINQKLDRSTATLKKSKINVAKTTTEKTKLKTKVKETFLPPGGLSGAGTGCCQVCPQQFYDEVSLLDVPLNIKQETVRRFHKHHGLQHFNPSSTTSFAEESNTGFAPNGLAKLAQTITAAAVGAMGMGQRIEHPCCPLCTANFMPPNDYMRQGSEPPGSAHAWGVSLLEKKTATAGAKLIMEEKLISNNVNDKNSRFKRETVSMKTSKGGMKTSKGGMMSSLGGSSGSMPMSGGVTDAQYSMDARGRQRCCNVCMEQLYPPRDWSDVNAFLELTHKNRKHQLLKKKKKLISFSSFIEISNKGFLSSLSSAAAGAAGAAGLGGGGSGTFGAPRTPPPCACRLCSEAMSGLDGEENKFQPSTDTNPINIDSTLQRPRNPMNKRMYAGGTPPGSKAGGGSSGSKAGGTFRL
jgi:hypothetical protein